MNALLALALTLRGARVALLLCDMRLPACEVLQVFPESDIERIASQGPNRRVCWTCHMPVRKFLAELKLPVWTFGQLCHLNGDRSTDDATLGVDLDGHALAGALRFYRRGDLVGQPAADMMLKRYVDAATMTAQVAARAIDEIKPDVAVFHHGIYVPQGVIGDVCRARGVRVVNWWRSYRRQTLLFTHDDTYHRTMIREPCDAWLTMPWDDQRRQAIRTYLDTRRRGSMDWISFAHTPTDDPSAVMSALKLDRSRPAYCLLTNVVWDAQVHFAANAFRNQIEWLRCTLNWFAGRPDLQLIVRVHPAETVAPASRQPIIDEVRRVLPTLPDNIRVVEPDIKLSTYAIADLCDAAIVFGTTTAVELAASGIPVIVAGEAWLRNKGVSHDVSSPQDYIAALETLPIGQRLDGERQDRALRYAYHLFFRRMIHVKSVGERTYKGAPLLDLNVEHLDDVRPGVDPGLDVICDGILAGRPFVADHRD